MPPNLQASLISPENSIISTQTSRNATLSKLFKFPPPHPKPQPHQVPVSSTGSEACASVIRAVHFIPPTFKRRQQQRRTRFRRKHKTQRSATTNDLAVSCARRAALSFLLLFSSFTSQPECALKKNHKRIHQQSDARDEEEKRNCNHGNEFTRRCALRVGIRSRFVCLFNPPNDSCVRLRFGIHQISF